MKKMLLVLAMFAVTSVHADLIELQNADEFNQLIENSDVPVMVSFSAYWCGPCQQLKATVKKVATSYNDSQIKIAYVDAYVNSSLKNYLMGGYPTVRTFKEGKLNHANFVGSKGESFVRSFIDELISARDEEVCTL